MVARNLVFLQLNTKCSIIQRSRKTIFEKKSTGTCFVCTCDGSTVLLTLFLTLRLLVVWFNGISSRGKICNRV